MDMHNQNWGKYGENLAVEFLKKQGFQIVERNFRTGFGEIDVVAQKDNSLRFVEVKTRLTVGCGQPEEAVHYLKKSRLLKAAKLYVAWREPIIPNYQIDVISILIDVKTRQSQITYFENVVLEKWGPFDLTVFLIYGMI